MNADKVVREQLLALLRGGNAHMDFESMIADFPQERINDVPPNVPYSPWQLLEHLRITQWDILEFIRDPDHESPDWPRGYWPSPSTTANEGQWSATITAFKSDLQDLIDMLEDPDTELYTDLPHAEGYTIMRELLLVADHNAYHIGEFAILRQVMHTWQ
ncbi:MAG: DinB family protein [Anaerolineales bacterium]|jgi:hypothetical protein